MSCNCQWRALIPAPRRKCFWLMPRSGRLFFAFLPLSPSTPLTYASPYWRLSALNATNDDESVATAAWATRWVVIQIACARAFIYRLINVLGLTFWQASANCSHWLMRRFAPSGLCVQSNAVAAAERLPIYQHLNYTTEWLKTLLV